MSINYRKGARSLEEFSNNIKEYSLYEQFLINVWSKEIKHIGFNVKITNSGIDNNGQLIEGRVGVLADYYIDGDIRGNYDIKTNPVSKYCTFKESLLKQYSKRKIGIVLFYGIGKEKYVLPPESRWCIIGYDTIDKMLSDCRPFTCHLFDGKPLIRIYQKDYSRYFNSHPLRLKHDRTPRSFS